MYVRTYVRRQSHLSLVAEPGGGVAERQALPRSPGVACAGLLHGNLAGQQSDHIQDYNSISKSMFHFLESTAYSKSTARSSKPKSKFLARAKAPETAVNFQD